MIDDECPDWDSLLRELQPELLLDCCEDRLATAFSGLRSRRVGRHDPLRFHLVSAREPRLVYCHESKLSSDEACEVQHRNGSRGYGRLCHHKCVPVLFPFDTADSGAPSRDLKGVTAHRCGRLVQAELEPIR